MINKSQTGMVLLAVSVFFIATFVAMYTFEFLWFLYGIICFVALGLIAAIIGNKNDDNGKEILKTNTR